MRRPTSLRLLPHYPVTGGTAVLAVAVTLFWWTGRPISALEMGPDVWRGEPWRLVTSCLPHGDVLHLLFNLYWLWVFGTLLEETWGRLRTLLLFVLLAAGSSAAEFAMFQGGIGLSGVGFGLFGLLWALRRQGDPYWLAVDRPTIHLFVGWFFLCIILTVTDILPVANVAHGVGAALGGLLGLAMAARRRRIYAVALFALLLAIAVTSTVARPYVNLSSNGLFQIGYRALQRGDAATAVVAYRRCLALNDRQADAWYNLGLAHLRLGRMKKAEEAFDRALRLEPDYRRPSLPRKEPPADRPPPKEPPTE